MAISNGESGSSVRTKLNASLAKTDVITVTQAVDLDAMETKLDGIEAGATADQTGAEIKTAYEAELDTNAFTDAEKTKLAGIEANADVTDTTNVTAAGALMDSEVTNLAQVKAFNSADYATAAQGATADSALQNVVEDTTPQLGGSLDVNGNSIVSTTNGNITLAPDGTGNVVLGNYTLDADATIGAGQDNYVLTYDNTSGTWRPEAAAGAGGGNAWSDVVDADIVPDADGTRDLGATATRFAEAYVDVQYVTNGLVLTEAADHPIVPAAGLAQLWVDNAATQTLQVTFDDGTDAEVLTSISGDPSNDGVASLVDKLFVAESPGFTGYITDTIDDILNLREDWVEFALSDETTDLTTGTAKITWRAPFAFTLNDVRASVSTAPTGAALTIDINEGGVSVLSTKLTIDATEKTSTTAATAAVISDSAIADDAEITIDIDQVGSTVAGAGAKVKLYYTRA